MHPQDGHGERGGGRAPPRPGRRPEAPEGLVTEQLPQRAGRGCLFSTVIGHRVRIFPNDRKQVSGYTSHPFWGNSLSFAKDFWRHKQEASLHNKLNLALLV